MMAFGVGPAYLGPPGATFRSCPTYRDGGAIRCTPACGSILRKAGVWSGISISALCFKGAFFTYPCRPWGQAGVG